MNSEYKKINEAEVILGVCMAFLVYILCFIFDLFAIGVVVSPVIQSFFTFGMWFFFKNHGDPDANKLNGNIAQYFGNLIPFIPAIVLSFAIKVFIHNHQQLGGMAAGIAQKL
ncbi:MAG: hypothetical protein ABSE68_00245 [Minisyncoccia bacterium]